VSVLARSVSELDVAVCETSVKCLHEDHTSTDLGMEVQLQE